MSNTFHSTTGRFALALAVSAAAFQANHALAAVTVYGGLPYNAATGTGYNGQTQPSPGTAVGRGGVTVAVYGSTTVASVGGVGVGIGTATPVNAGASSASVGQRFTPTGAAALIGLATGTTAAYGVSATGTVVGVSQLNTGGTDLGPRAVYWAPGAGAATQFGAFANTTVDGSGTFYPAANSGATLSAVNPTTGVGSSQAFAVNGTFAAGSSNAYSTLNGTTSSAGTRAVRWNTVTGTATLLAALPNNYSFGGMSFSNVTSINASGVAVGVTTQYAGAGGSTLGNLAVRWAADGSVTNLGSLYTAPSGIANSFAYKVNAAGSAVGFSAVNNATGQTLGNRATYWAAGSSTPVELVAPGTFASSSGDTAYTYAFDINVTGEAVGSASVTSVTDTRAVRWNTLTNTVTTLGTLGTSATGTTSAVANAVSDNGLIVGNALTFSATGTSQQVATYWGLDDKAVDLNTLLAANSGWLLTNATGITADGWVSGLGTFTDTTGSYSRAFLLQVPEPASLGLIGLAGVAFLRRARRA